MTDDDLVRRGDARKVADEVFDRLEKKGADQAAFGAAEVCEAIAVLPAQGVDALVKAAAQDAREVFEDYGSKAREAIDYMEQVALAAIREGRK